MIPNHHLLLDQQMNFGIREVDPTTSLSSLVSPLPYHLHHLDIRLISLLVARPTLCSSAEEVYLYESLVEDQQAMKVSEVIA